MRTDAIAKTGTRVMGITAGGAMARHVVVHERTTMPIPDRLSFTEAAAIPEVFLTAHDALFTLAELKKGERVLIHAVASGVGTAAIQLARVHHVMPFGTTRSPDKIDRAKALGLQAAIVPSEGRFAEAFLAATGGERPNVILDAIGAAYFEENLSLLATKGRLVIIGLMGGATAEAPLGQIVARRLRVIGSVLRSRSVEEKIAATERFAKDELSRFSSGDLRPIVDAVLPMSSVAEAHKRMEANDTFGKVVLQW
jgi:NADPH:quinone reductase